MGIIAGLVEHLIISLIYLAVIATDIVCFFLLVHIVARRWPKRIIIGLDQIGSPLVETLTSATQEALPRLPEAGRLLLLVALLTLCRLGFVALMQALR